MKSFPVVRFYRVQVDGEVFEVSVTETEMLGRMVVVKGFGGTIINPHEDANSWGWFYAVVDKLDKEADIEFLGTYSLDLEIQ
jgi:hypothetical protein